MTSPVLEKHLNGQNNNKVKEEKILVTVRVRPLSNRERAQQDRSVWDCIEEKTISFKLALPDRSPHSKSYKFDRVFGPESLTHQVYEEGAKDVALSALSGLNATIFAYGQTSSGKTYTMKGVTESAVLDIYDYINKHSERDFVLKVSALEIYNEVVRDLLNSDSGPLRLLDDPEKGTVVERLVEEVVRDNKHLQEVLAVCEAQRQVGETTLNDTSSRSHQIIRLTVESFPRREPEGGIVKSLLAALNFVDLAGSERASQTMAEGTRLKEGCHINRSLLTLTTIIRRLSVGKGKTGHLPYRDSKLTRILQNSLGGNSRTAIICTMSPALSHVEQSRNTLHFATRAKEVTNTAHVNMVVSDKALVKQLQREVARLEAELRLPESVAFCSSDTEVLLQEKDALIRKMELQMKEVMEQRDAAQARLNDLLRKIEEEEQLKNLERPSLSPCHQPPSDDSDCTPLRTFKSTYVSQMNQEFPNKDSLEEVVCSRKIPILRQSVRQSASASVMLVQEIRKLEHLQNELGEDANRALEALQKEVECLRLAHTGMNQDAAITITKLQAEIHKMHQLRTDASQGQAIPAKLVTGSVNTSLREEINRLQAIGEEKAGAGVTIATLEEQLESVQKSINNLVLNANDANPSVEKSPMKAKTPTCRKKTIPLTVKGNNQTCTQNGSSCSPRSRRSLFPENNENHPPFAGESMSLHPAASPAKSEEADTARSSKESMPLPNHCRNNSVDIKKMQNMFKTAAEENIRSIRTYVTELKERVAKLQYQKQLLVCQVLELEANANCEEDDGDLNQAEEERASPAIKSPATCLTFFQEQQMQIIELWELCQVPLVHRTQFYLLFRGGDPSDSIYMEVELRRLTWLYDHFSHASSPSPGSGQDEQAVSLISSFRALRREKELLAKRMRTRLAPEEREELFQKWGIPLDTKQRKLQLAMKLWTDTHDKAHIQESAELVARLVNFWEPGMAISKEMFELTFAPPSNQKPWFFGWNPMSLLNL